ncbi:MBL fold metallo-hydrolase [Aliishimia ponticola]|uniref:MBL fold metallo-hydrolase n=1 Tax=Aliishimia ponticola TaxID=2499833 RepID=A0A4S4N7S9_9RHOB|nr:MBL fold metallo-hydrolase [Aliishimia ponticola]THH35226.1 MBL fold metallo-hydrolase [Aliishimia ponticola]
MTASPKISRRTALAGAAALPLAAAASRGAQAAAPVAGASAPQFMRVKVGAFDVTNILAGTRTVPGPKNIFGLNVDDDTFAQVSADANISTEAAQFFFHPPVVNTGEQLILFDTGLQGPATVAALEAAGYTADQVDIVVLTHMHGDHIGGLMTDGAPTFPNASYITGRTEYDAWAKMDNENFEAKVRPLAEQMTFLEDGGTVASGITAMSAFGHTPGHTVYMLESDGKQMLLGADFANHYVWSLAHPTWEVKFDMDKQAAADTRKTVLDMLSADKIPFSSYHMPFPAFGYVDTHGEGYHYVPHTYQLLMTES